MLDVLLILGILIVGWLAITSLTRLAEDVEASRR